MASTRNKNTKTDYQLEKRNNQWLIEYNTSLLQVDQPYCYVGDGLVSGGRVDASKLSHNAVDIESSLRGYDTNDLEHEQPRIQPQLRSCIKSLHMYKKPVTYMPDPLIIEANQRPTLH